MLSLFLLSIIRLNPGQNEVHTEFVDPAPVDDNRLTLQQLRLLHPRRSIQIPHQGRNPRIRLGMADDIHLQAILFDGFQINPLGNLLYQFAQQVDGLPTITLQILDDLLAGQKGLGLFFQALDLVKLLIQNGNSVFK